MFIKIKRRVGPIPLVINVHAIQVIGEPIGSPEEGYLAFQMQGSDIVISIKFKSTNKEAAEVLDTILKFLTSFDLECPGSPQVLELQEV